jgi:UDPglucose 6-dehydrogenase
MKRNTSIGVFGLWHLGCVISTAWSSLKHKVTAFDSDETLIKNLSKGVPPIFEPNLSETILKNIKKKLLFFTSNLSDLRACDFIFLAYDTPVLDDDRSDLTLLENAIQDLGAVLKNGAIVIVSSQTPAGTCALFRKKLKTKNPSLDLVCSPENLRLGEALKNYISPERIVLGVEDKNTKKKIISLFKAISAQVLTVNLTSAEMVKHGINSFLAESITFTNELADICEKSGADITDVVRGMKTDSRIGEKAYLSPGIGFSGGTLGRDLRVLDSLGGTFFGEIFKRNAGRKKTVIERLKSILAGKILAGRKVGVLGITYKPGTSTLRRSLPVEIVRELVREGSLVSIYDPLANYSEWKGEKIFRVASAGENIVRDSEIVLVLTEWPQFQKLPWKSLLKKKSPQIIFDAKNCPTELDLNQIGYRYLRVGKN